MRASLGARADAIEAIEVLTETPYADLPASARARLGLDASQKNVLLRVVLRELTRALGRAEANRLRNAIYDAVHEGPIKEWA